MENPYLKIQLQSLDGYRPGDCSAGDLDGDGQYEIVIHRTSKGIDPGINIREGEHYTQFMVYDLDGKAPALSDRVIWWNGDLRREELLVADPEGKSIRLYTTTISMEHRITTLMHDPQYRLTVAWRNVVYNKPPHVSCFLGEGMRRPVR